MGGVAEVVTTDLVVRSAPGGGEDSFVYPRALDAPTLLFVLDGPVAASGYDWYLVDPFAMARADDFYHGRLGWVAAGSRDGEAWIAPASVECPEPNFDGLIGLSQTGAVACFGDEQLTVEGVYGDCGVATGTRMTGPGWLLGASCILGSFDSPAEPGRFDFHISPDLSTSEFPSLGYEPGTAIRIVGHFDDPAAQECRAYLGELAHEQEAIPTPARPGDVVLHEVAAVLSCRGGFVVTEAAPIDP